MFEAIHKLFNELISDSIKVKTIESDTVKLAIASLLCEVSAADYEKDNREEDAKSRILQQMLNLDPKGADELLERAEEYCKGSVSVYEYTSKLRSVSDEQRLVLIDALWQVAYADGKLDEHEEALIKRISDLIYIDDEDYEKSKLTAQLHYEKK